MGQYCEREDGSLAFLYVVHALNTFHELEKHLFVSAVKQLAKIVLGQSS